jgi:ABC-type polysaccharide/polyol phosphate export permease
MGLIELTVQLIIAAIITFNLTKLTPKLYIMIIFAVIVFVFCWAMGIYLSITFSEPNLKDLNLHSAIGTGLWFSMGGVIYGLVKGYMAKRRS